MGGYNSGRRGWHVTVEAGLVLDLNRLIRIGSVVPDSYHSGDLHWTRGAARERIATIGCVADLSVTAAPTLRLRYTIIRDGNATSKSYTVRLTFTLPHFGGKRWWFVCPITGSRAGKLYLPPGADVFASRTAYRLAYQSQRDSDMDRSHSRQRRIYARLGVEYQGYEQGAPRRRKWMREATYARLLAELDAAEDNHDLIFIAGASRLLAREAILNRRSRHRIS